MAEKKKIVFGKYEMGRLLGKGTFAKVFHGRHLVTNEFVAIKVIKKAEVIQSERMMEQIKREISVMRLVRHPNVVELKEVMATKFKIFFVMEYVRGGELFAAVERGRLKEDAARRYFQQLISAVDFCHSRGVFHRDLKPENLLLDEDGNLKVSDFGLSALRDGAGGAGAERLLHTQCGTPAYIPPEVLKMRGGYDGAKADIWSCGVVLYVLLAGFLPFQDGNLLAMYKKIYKADYRFPPWFSGEARRLISKLLVPDPGKRISIPGIMRVGWFRKGFKSPNAFSLQESLFDKFDEDDKLAGAGETNFRKSPSSPAFLNAFQFISSVSTGFDLSSMFEDSGDRRVKAAASTFTSRCSARVIMAKMEMAGRKLGFRVAKVKDFKLRMLGSSEGRKGRLSVTAEVFKVAPEVTVVEFSKFSGDTLEYVKFREEEMRPSLRDVVWTWQGESPLRQSQSQMS
ncbi:CBL-interacting serine/threonine-protein kinase 5-like [Andrographis paniculata]|uniref:CBL-interacting serine/threonine-protein kinase 5-like n=1 Tax=Andrographis paniculata TaxID=175694 RepID=UPI0021E6E0EA|nr:CBL-interacting serine/threonine-protein kinase 5-like [Andrographis paniculata]